MITSEGFKDGQDGNGLRLQKNIYFNPSHHVFPCFEMRMRI